mgnify:CR=1 FL=1
MIYSDDYDPYYKNPRHPFRNRGSGYLNQILTIILLVIVAIIVIATIVNFSTRKESLKEAYRKADPQPQAVIKKSKKSSESVDAFTSIGQLRINVKAQADKDDTLLLIITPWFTYPSADNALFEELSQKERSEKSLIMNYFSRYTKEELLQKGEEEVKQDLVSLINSQLIMGKIRAVYFDQYLFLE